MAKSNQNRKKKKLVLKKGFLLHWGYIALIIVMIVQGVRQQPHIDSNKRRIAQLTQEIEYEKQRTEEVEAWTRKVNTDEYIENVARTKLGLGKNNEIIFIDASNSSR